jgi:hypothetical protein
MHLIFHLPRRLLLGVLCFGAVGAAADQVLTSCTEAALDAALAQGGRIVLTCGGTITTQTTKVIVADTVLEAGDSQVTLSGGASNRLFLINPGVTLTLRGLTLSQGRHEGVDGSDGGELEDGGSGKPGYGGAVFNDGGTLIAVQVTFATNQVTGGNGGAGAVGQFLGADGRDGGRGGAGTGGAIQNRSGLLLLTNCTFVANLATGGEGGRGGDGAELLLAGSGGDGGDGGHGQGAAIYSEDYGEVVLVDCTFRDNVSQGGLAGEPGWAGGANNFDGSLGDAGKGEGGALFGGTGSVVGLRSTFSQNRVRGADALDGLEGFNSRTGMDGGGGGAGRGGALAFLSMAAAFTNSTFFSNNATGGIGGDGGEGGNTGFGGDGGDGGRGGSARGGSVYHGSASAGTYVHCTFSSALVTGGSGGAGGAAGTNTSDPGGRGSPGLTEGANLTTDSGAVELFFTILADGVGDPNIFGTINDGGFNLSSDGTPAFSHPESLNDTDPLLSTLANNGGLTQTMALSSNSPARDRNSAELLVNTDQRGYVRVNQPDAGAFEYDVAVELQIQAQGSQVVLSWPAVTPQLRLQSSGTLLASDWQLMTGAVQSGSVYVITNAATGSARYYRLVR